MAGPDDTPPQGVPALNPANRELVELLTNHALAMQASVQEMRLIIRELWGWSAAVNQRQALRIETWFRELADRTAAAAAAAHHCCQKEAPP